MLPVALRNIRARFSANASSVVIADIVMCCEKTEFKRVKSSHTHTIHVNLFRCDRAVLCSCEQSHNFIVEWAHLCRAVPLPVINDQKHIAVVPANIEVACDNAVLYPWVINRILDTIDALGESGHGMTGRLCLHYY